MIVRFERGTFSHGFFPRGYFSAAARTHLAAGIRVDIERRARDNHELHLFHTGAQCTTERFPHRASRGAGAQEAQATYEFVRFKWPRTYIVRMRRFVLFVDLTSSSDDE